MSSVSLGTANATMVYLLPTFIIEEHPNYHLEVNENKDGIIPPYKFKDSANSICKPKIKKPLVKTEMVKMEEIQTECLKPHTGTPRSRHARTCGQVPVLPQLQGSVLPQP